MHNFVFHNPTKVLFGRGTIPLCGQEAKQWGRRVLLVYGRHWATESGVLRQVHSLLQDAGLEVVCFGGAQPNPTLAHVHQGIRMAKAQDIEVVCALGGGSVIDSAKAISAGALVEHDVWKFFTGKKSIKAALPLVAISTMAASGSEMNSGMVLTNTESKQKFGFANRLLYPRVAIMDPETTFSVSPHYTAYGAIDALAHLLEFYLTTTQSGIQLQEQYMEGLARTIVCSCEAALVRPDDYEARANLMWAAGLALNGMAAAGLGKVGFPMHLIEHSLSGLYDIPHGAGLGVVIPGWLRSHAEVIPDRISRFFSRAFSLNFSGLDGASQAIDQFDNWLARMGLATTLAEFGVGGGQIEQLAENCVALARIWRIREYDQAKIAKVLTACRPL
jgi:alcohol dehydrogenase YqhD (iron-dependent ADH family)